MDDALGLGVMRHQFCSWYGRGVVLGAECSKMTLSIDSHPFGVSRRVTSAKSAASAHKAKRLDDLSGRQTERQIADLKRRIPILKRLIVDCHRMAADLDQEVRSEEDRVKIHDAAHPAYSTYAKATASRRDNLRRSAGEFRDHLAKAEKALLELGEATLEA